MQVIPLKLIRVFRQPLLIASILVLLVNDHLLKALAPSWLTGKLSDFAGLFFFPFLLGLLIECLPSQNWKVTRVLAILITAVSFAIIKTVPTVNIASVIILEKLLSVKVQIIRDPSDLLALAVLPGAFFLWGRWLQPTGLSSSRKTNYAILGLGVLACIATSPCPPWASMRHLVLVGDMLYAATQTYADNSVGPVYSYDQNSNAWQLIEQPDAQVITAARQLTHLPITRCDPQQPQRCFRIDGRPRIEQSEDGGSTWKTAWQITPGREVFIHRIALYEYCMKDPEVATFDLVILPTASGSLVVAAAGNEGVILRSADGSWQRSALGETNPIRPTPIAAQDFRSAWQATSMEFILAACATLLAYSLASIWGRNHFRLQSGDRTIYPTWALHPAWFVTAWLISIPLFVIAVQSPAVLRGTVVHAAACALALEFLILLTTTTSTKPGPSRRAGWLVLLTCLVLLLIPLGFFLAWAYGWMDSYTVACCLGITTTISVGTPLVIHLMKTIPESTEMKEPSPIDFKK
jgi:hypothetical protein